MSTDQTTNIGLPFVMPAQAQKHVTVNESLTRLDALVQLAVESRALDAEPASPGDGQIWILPPGKTGTAWDLFGNWSLGYYRDGAWEQLSPKAGWRAWVKDEARTLVYDGAEWVAPAEAGGFRNAVINGGFDVAQRGTSFSGETSGGYHLDRWRAQAAGGTYDVARQAFTPGQTDVPGEPAYYMDFEVTGASADVGPETRIEDVRTLAGEQATLSFYARSSSVPGDFKANLIQNFGAGGSAAVTATSPAFALTSSWRRFTWTASLASISGKTIGAGSYLGLRLRNADSETWQADIACVQLEAGASATAFERRPVGLEEELCKRYYERLVAGASYTVFGYGLAGSATAAYLGFRYARKRAAPSFAFSGVRLFDGATAFSSLSLGTGYIGVDAALQTFTTTGLTAQRFVYLQASNNPAAYVAFDAEL